MRVFVLAVVCVLSLLGARTAHATHFRYGTINYRLPDPADPRVVDLEVTVAWRSSYLPVDSTVLAFGDGTTGPATVGVNIGYGFDATGGQYTVYRYTLRHTYPAPGQYVASFTSCCRLSSLINAGDRSFTVRAVVDATVGNTSGPIAGTTPFLQLQTGGVRTLLVPARDPDGPISCRFSTPNETGDATTIHPPIANGQAPTIATVTDGCLVTWNLTNATAGQSYVLSVVIASGSGETTVDAIVELLSSPPITCTGSGSINAYVNEPTSWMVTGQAPSATNLTSSLLSELGSLSNTSGASPLTSTATLTAVTNQRGLRLALMTFTTPQFRSGWCYQFVNVATPTCGNDHYELEACDGTSLAPSAACPAGYEGTPLCNNDPANPNGNGTCTLDPLPDGCVDIDECALGTDTCAMHATCTNMPGSYTCTCASGWTGDGFTCGDIDECTTGTAGCAEHATCTNAPGTFDCACDQGWSGDGFTCTDVDECAMQGTCDTNASCTNELGAFTCACNMGWDGDGFTCADVDECALGTDACDPQAACANTVGSYTCTCEAGWSGDGFTCTDVDECTDGASTCDEHALCTNTTGSYTCACAEGWTGDGTTCTDIDECASGTAGCDPHATCTNLPGSVACACNSGWMGSGTTCGDVDECGEGLDDCPATSACVNDTGAFHCECPAGHTGDGYVCAGPEEEEEEEEESSGGCGCTAGGDSNDGALATWLLLGVALVVTGRRRRPR